MLTCPLSGNHGNHQLFYSATRVIAETLGYNWGFNPHPEFDYHHGEPQMSFMDIDYGIEHDAKYLELPNGITNIWHEKYVDIPNSDGASFHFYDPTIWNLPDNTKLVLRCCQDARYFEHKKEDMKRWFKIKLEKIEEYESIISEREIVFDDNLCCINIRGGEYKNIPSLILSQSYWLNAIDKMKQKGIKKFIVITDDVSYVNQLLPDIPAYHFSIGCDYYILTQAHNLILSNSSFAILPVWLSEKHPYVIAPRYWARHNISDGYWASSDIWTFGKDGNWQFLDRDGELYER